jgi:RNA polymerase sigma-70 factor (sigma-E family)
VKRTDREAAYIEFVTARRARLRKVAYAICGDWDLADDVLQQALVKLYVAWPRVRRDGREEAYVRRILMRTNIDESRRPWRRERPTDDVPDTARPNSLPYEEHHALVQALQYLPEIQRKVVLLRHWLGLSVAETAAELHLVENTVKSHSSRGLKALRQILGQSEVIP